MPVTRSDVTVKRLTGHDLSQFRELIVIYKDVFQMENFSLPSEQYLKSLIANSHFIAVTANFENSVIGGLTAYVLPSTYSESAEVYIYDLAVSASFQRRGIGRKIIEFFKQFCRENSYKTFFVQADLADEHAMEFYRNTGGAEERVVHYDYPL
jgi:aminoglycoside 3-N-acetyltransferase I